MKTTTPRATSARYTMTSQDEALAVRLARSAGEPLDDRHWMLVGGTRSLAGQLGRMLEQRVFDREYGGHGPQMMAEQYGPYEDRTVHAVIIDDEGAVAAARTIWSPDPSAPTKLEADLDLLDGSLRTFHRLEERYGSLGISELATAVVEPRARGTIVTGWVLGEMRYQQMRIAPQAPSCAMIDAAFHRMIRIWGHQLSPAAGLEPSHYMGHVCQPTFFEPGPQEQVRQSRLYKVFSDGWLQRAVRPNQSAPSVDITEASALSI